MPFPSPFEKFLRVWRVPGDPLLESGGKAPAPVGNSSGFRPVWLREVDSPAESPGELQC